MWGGVSSQIIESTSVNGIDDGRCDIGWQGTFQTMLFDIGAIGSHVFPNARNVIRCGR